MSLRSSGLRAGIIERYEGNAQINVQRVDLSGTLTIRRIFFDNPFFTPG
jgi:hypothetical protein